MISFGAPVRKGQWLQQIAAAKATWGKLSEVELRQCQGHAPTLAGMVRQCYAISHEAAEKQVDRFFDKHCL